MVSYLCNHLTNVLAAAYTHIQSLKIYFRCLIVVVIITWPSEEHRLQNEHDIRGFRVSDRIKWVDLCRIPNMMSCFSTIQRPLSVFYIFLFAVFNNCWYTTPHFLFNYYSNYNINSKQSSKSKPYLQVIKQFRCKCLWHLS